MKTNRTTITTRTSITMRPKVFSEHFVQANPRLGVYPSLHTEQSRRNCDGSGDSKISDLVSVDAISELY